MAWAEEIRSKAEARRRAAVEEDKTRQLPGTVDRKAGRTTWGAWADEWWPRRKVEPGTLARDLSRRRTHLAPRWDTVRLDSITRDAVQAWVDDLHAGGMAPSTVARCYHLLSASMRAAVLAGRIAASPCVSIDLPTTPPPDERFLTWEEVEAITHFLPPRDSLLVWFLVGTGLRWGEAVGAHRHRLHLEQQRLDVHEVWDERIGEIKPYPKGRQKRTVPLPGWLVEKLQAYLAEQPETATCAARHRSGSRCRSALIVPGRGGAVVEYHGWRRTRWADACAKAKIGGVTIHDLRHTYASWLVQDGVSIEALSELLGHASVITTQRYAHLGSSQWDAVRGVLEAKGNVPGQRRLRSV
jgi:integrase